jgi:ubiquinol-cytochrome c reductase cytochrome b subunit
MAGSDRSPSGIERWLDERFPLAAIIRWGIEEDIPGGPRYFFTLGSTALFLFALEVITGLWQMLYYVPTVDHAYSSVMYLRLQVPLGWLLHGLHYWGANAFVVVICLHVIRVFVWGAYKKPRELVWTIGVLLLLSAAALSFTGAVLPWDMRGYWAGEVGTSMAGTVPVVGGFLRALMRGGSSMAQSSLSRFFVAHIGLLPAILLLLVSLHLVAFRRFGSAGAWDADAARRTGPFWPDQVFMDMVVVSAVFFLLICLSAFSPAPITGPADPLDNYYVPRPEWNFLFLYEILKAFKGPLERIGTVGVPLLLILVLFLAPFIDRGETRNPRKRPRAMAAGLLVLAVIIVPTILAYRGSPAGSQATSSFLVHSGGTDRPASTDPQDSASAGAKASQTGGAATARRMSVERGEALFASTECLACHTIEGRGGKVGPDLSFEARIGRTRRWLRVQITNPARHNPHTIMPAAKGMTNRELSDLIDFLLQPPASGGSETTGTGTKAEAVPKTAPSAAPETARAAPPTAGAQKAIAAGRLIYEGECLPCHGASGKGDGPAALALPKRVTVSDLTSPAVTVYSDSSLFEIVAHGRADMPAFESILTGTQLWQVIDYMRTLAPPATGRKSDPPPSSDPASPETGEALFGSLGCIACHRIHGQGGAVGPDLSNEGQSGRSKSWLREQILRPAAHNPQTIMPAHPNLSNAELDSLVSHLLAPPPKNGAEGSATPKEDSALMPSPAEDIIGDANHGRVLFEVECRSCHGEKGQDHVANPGSTDGTVPALAPIDRALFSSDPSEFTKRIDPFPQNGSTPAGPGPRLRMPAFGATHALTQEEIANIEAYVLELNGVKRAEIVNPGVRPAHFVAGAGVLFALALVAVIVTRTRNRKDIT